MTNIAQLTDRSLLRLSGSDVVDFLQNLITCDVESLSAGSATFGALLTPQGKVLFDFFLQRTEDGFFIDVATPESDALAQRLKFYKLRADVTIDSEGDQKVFVAWDGEKEDGFSDPRLKVLGKRFFSSASDTNANEIDWHAHRISHGVPQSGLDFDLGEYFPHEVLMDQFQGAGVDFTKGCYVGQEVVSRMQHRGTARKRWVIAETQTTLPEKGTALDAENIAIGTIGSSFGKTGLAVVRLDRAKKAMDSGGQIKAGGIDITLKLPAFVSFGWPG